MDADVAPKKLKVDVYADGAVTCLKLSGSLDEEFNGKSLASSVKARTLVLHMAEIRRISSFGIREWIDFMETVSGRVEDIILIECAPKVVDQLNMVANFIGRGRVFSFYAPYRCDYCDAEDRVLMQMDRDHEAIASLRPLERPCPRCGEAEYMDENPATYLGYLATQPRFELPPEVRAMLANKLRYALPDVPRRLTVDKQIEGRCTYLGLSGDLDSSFPRGKLAEGLEGTIIIDLSGVGRVEPVGAAEWRSFLAAVMPSAESIYLVGVPPLFLEKLCGPDDLGPKVRVVMLALPYACTSCGSAALYAVEVDEHYDLLKFATPPDLLCKECKQPVRSAATDSMLSRLATLPRPNMTAQARAALQAIKERKNRPRTSAGSGRGGKSIMAVIAAAALAAMLTAGGFIAYTMLATEKPVASPEGVGKLVEASADKRPAWVSSDARLASYCTTDAELGLACVGVSSYAATEPEAREEAENAALEAVANAVLLRIAEPSIAQGVGSIFLDTRKARFSAYTDAVATSPGSVQYERARHALIDGQRAVAQALRKTAGDLVPATPTASHWERYDAVPGPGSRYLVLVRYEMRAADVDKLIERYSRVREVLGAKLATTFPGIAWRYPELEGGAVIATIGDGTLRSAGLAEHYVVLSVQDRPVKDVNGFERITSDELARMGKEGGTGELRLQVKTGDAAPVDFTVVLVVPRTEQPEPEGEAAPEGAATP